MQSYNRPNPKPSPDNLTPVVLQKMALPPPSIGKACNTIVRELHGRLVSTSRDCLREIFHEVNIPLPTVRCLEGGSSIAGMDVNLSSPSPGTSGPIVRGVFAFGIRANFPAPVLSGAALRIPSGSKLRRPGTLCRPRPSELSTMTGNSPDC